MTISKKSLTGTLQCTPASAPSVPDPAQPVEAPPVKQTLAATDCTLSKRTVSRILLAKSLFGR